MTPGGSSILSYNVKALTGGFDWKLSMQKAIELPNLVARASTFSSEPELFSKETLDGLATRGIVLKAGFGENSGLHGIIRRPNGLYEGGADPRREGIARWY